MMQLEDRNCITGRHQLPCAIITFTSEICNLVQTNRNFLCCLCANLFKIQSMTFDLPSMHCSGNAYPRAHSIAPGVQSAESFGIKIIMESRPKSLSKYQHSNRTE
jgi:hypothetical protein